MNQFQCKRLRLCTYLMDRGFSPVQTVPDEQNPKFSVFLFDETPELTAAVTRYFAVDCMTARMNNERNKNNETSEQCQRI